MIPFVLRVDTDHLRLLTAFSSEKPMTITAARQACPGLKSNRAGTVIATLASHGLVVRVGVGASNSRGGPPQLIYLRTPAGDTALLTPAPPEPPGPPRAEYVGRVRHGSQAGRLLRLLTDHPQSIGDLLIALGLDGQHRPGLLHSATHLRKNGLCSGSPGALVVTPAGRKEQARLLALDAPVAEPAEPPEVVAERRAIDTLSGRAQNAYRVLTRLSTRTSRTLAAQCGFGPAVGEEVWNELQRAGLT